MQTEQLEYFLSIAQTGSYTESSYRLMISQSSLSKQITKLEDELNTKLFIRGKNKVTLTESGEHFLQYALQAWQSWQDISNKLQNNNQDNQTLIISSVDHLGKVGLTAPIASFIQQHPNSDMIHLEMKKSHARQVVEWLLNGESDVCITAQIIDTFNQYSNLKNYDLTSCYTNILLKDQYYAIVPPNHPFASRKIITWQDLANESLLLLDQSNSLNGIVRQAFSEHGSTPHIVFECGQTDTLLGMVADGYGITLLSGHIASSSYNVKQIEIKDPILRNTMLITKKSTMKQKGLAYQFIRHIVKEYSESNIKNGQI